LWVIQKWRQSNYDIFRPPSPSLIKMIIQKMVRSVIKLILFHSKSWTPFMNDSWVETWIWLDCLEFWVLNFFLNRKLLKRANFDPEFINLRNQSLNCGDFTIEDTRLRPNHTPPPSDYEPYMIFLIPEILLKSQRNCHKSIKRLGYLSI